MHDLTKAIMPIIPKEEWIKMIFKDENAAPELKIMDTSLDSKNYNNIDNEFQKIFIRDDIKVLHWNIWIRKDENYFSVSLKEDHSGKNYRAYIQQDFPFQGEPRLTKQWKI